jgi:hypothetical protein
MFNKSLTQSSNVKLMVHMYTPDFSPVGILHLHARSQNGAMPHWCWVSNYTPFGFGMPERSYTSTAAGYRWGFQLPGER